MSYSLWLKGPDCILKQHKILELKKTQGPFTFQRLLKAGYVEIRIAVSVAQTPQFKEMAVFYNSSP